ncbi:MAG: hypothetical protein ACPGYV_07855 [Phycisphaeraceae bacterium]
MMPHRLDLYRWAVQHPLAEVAFIEHCWAQVRGGSTEPTLLREDFAGSCAVAAAWVASDPERQAMAIEIDGATAAWAAARYDDADLHIVDDDVMAVDGPAVDVTLALNFSVLYWRDRAALDAYLKIVFAGLRPGGLFVMDLFGGSKLDRPRLVRRRVEPDEGGAEPFDLVWEQGGVDPATGRVTCRLHFEWEDGRSMRDAFVYDWRLWSVGEIVDAARAAGFAEARAWWSDPNRPGRHRPIEGEPSERDWVAYVVCEAGDIVA